MERLHQLNSHVSPLVKVNVLQSTMHISLNRPKALNSLNLELLEILRGLLSTAQEKALGMVFTGEGRAFCAGGDVVSISKDSQLAAPFSRKSSRYFTY